MITFDVTGIKIIIDFVINHSSDEHIWFKKSVEKIKPFDEFYVWKDPKGYDSSGKPIPPNNWVCSVAFFKSIIILGFE